MLYRYGTLEHTITNMATVGDPTSQTDNRDLKAGTSEMSVFHFPVMCSWLLYFECVDVIRV